MSYKSDIEIAQEASLLPISFIAQKLGINSKYVEHYGENKAKINNTLLNDMSAKPDGKLILVTAINPTPAGEGKTTITVGIADGLRALGKNAVAALREPSLGPVFGIKGGAAGGGYAQVIPMEDINLHFTGDFHAIGAANNLLAAILDNHIQQGNALNIDIRKITWKRALDMNDRQLRSIVCGLGGKLNGIPREDGFDITVASEVMAVLCLSLNIEHLKENLSKIIVAYTYDDKPVTVKELKAQGAMAALLKDAIKPNLVQTLEHSPVFIHGGPFANIAHGCNSVVATKMALKLGDYAITEAGFGADLGAEKFLNIKCRLAKLAPSVVVTVVTVCALKYHGEATKASLEKKDMQALENGLPNLLQHIENIVTIFKIPTVVAINKFPGDTAEEIQLITKKCQEMGVHVALSEVWQKGGQGGIDIANKIIQLADLPTPQPSYAYELHQSIEEKITHIATKIYRAKAVVITSKAAKQIAQFTALGYGTLPICMAKTQYSFSDDAALLGAPRDFVITIRSLKLAAGAGFIVALTGDIMTMPGLPKIPSAERIDIDKDGKITGLF